MKGWMSSSNEPEAMPRGAFDGALGAGAGASAMVWLPLLWGLPCAIAGRGAARWGGYRFCAFVVMCRAALRRGRAAAACAFGVSVALAAQLSIISAGSATEVWSGAAGDVFYRPSSAIGMCGGGMVAFFGAKVTIRRVSCSRLQDDVSEHAEGSLLAEGSAGVRAAAEEGGKAGSITKLQYASDDRMRGAGAASDADWGPPSMACSRWQASARKKRRPEAISEG